jgi:lipopolysaccharide/colanic/teichoic acid biosynthesis glycosyltransferase
MFDVGVILALTPPLLPLLGLIALAIVVFSGRPTIFRQTRSGRYGRPFTIFKFRTMTHGTSERRFDIAAHAANEITALGRLLRRLKLDELPQAWNVLRGDMSLVGPRPKVPEQQLTELECRPGLTGPATLAFACEERMFARIPRENLHTFYQEIVLPAKHRLDAHYMARATVLSDLRILLLTASGRWHISSLNLDRPRVRPDSRKTRLQPGLSGAEACRNSAE